MDADQCAQWWSLVTLIILIFKLFCFCSGIFERKSEQVIEDGTVWCIILMHSNLFSNHNELKIKVDYYPNHRVIISFKSGREIGNEGAWLSEKNALEGWILWETYQQFNHISIGILFLIFFYVQFNACALLHPSILRFILCWIILFIWRIKNRIFSRKKNKNSQHLIAYRI